MKISLWFLVVLLGCVFSPARCDCQGECVACGLLLQEQQLEEAFDSIVCLLECEGHVSSSLTWEVCKRAMKLSPSPLSEGPVLFKRADGAGLTPPVGPSAERLQDDEAPYEEVHYDSSPLESSQEGVEGSLQGFGGAEVGRNLEDDPVSSEGLTLSKRFGGFQRGRHGYRKLIGPPMRPLQKRYGGFIGVRKSARKWNSQKRVNQLLRQYLGMRSNRSGRLNSIPVSRVWRQNKL